MKTILYCTILILLISSCTRDSANSNEHTSKYPAKANNIRVDLSEGGLPLVLVTESTEKKDYVTEWNAAFGRMEIAIDAQSQIFISQDTLTCAAKKDEIESGIFKVSYIENTDSLIFYKTTLPDGSTPYWHFFASFEINGVNYNFENDPLIECTEKQIEQMTEFVGKIEHTDNETRKILQDRIRNNLVSDNRGGSK